MTGLEVALGFLVTWVLKKAGRVAKRADQTVDAALDTAMDRVHKLVIDKLGPDPALERLQLEAASSGQITDRTRTRVQLALEEAADNDPDFTSQLQAAIDSAPATSRAITITGDNTGIASTGDSTINIQHR